VSKRPDSKSFRGRQLARGRSEAFTVLLVIRGLEDAVEKKGKAKPGKQ
jgi:hypothetical protein